MKLRQTNIEKLRKGTFDVLIIGGGINGAVAAAALAGKGVKVALIDKGDFAGHTSSNSSNLAWGGIKYLENMELLLVNKLCRSRNHLMRAYPSTVKEIRFFTTIAKGFRLPTWFIFMGTLFYWALGRFFTKPPRYLSKSTIEQEEPAVNTANARGGFEYSDCYLYDNDARFVFNFIRTGLNYGCVATNYVASIGAERHQDHWQVMAEDQISGEQFPVRAKVLINACGPFVDAHNRLSHENTEHHHLLSKGIHLIIDQVTKEPRVLTFFASDGRLFFVIPMGRKTCIGTTDAPVTTPEPEVTEADREFVLNNINALLKLPKPITKDDIIAERCGVRPLAVKGEGGEADWIKLSRKHAIDVDEANQHISIFGGKLTDCLNVGEEVVDRVKAMAIPISFPDHRWYGEPDDSVKQEFLHQAKLMDLDSYTDPISSEPLTERFWRRYGAEAIGLLERIRQDPSSTRLLIENAEYTRCEIEQAARREVIVKLEDFLRRRSKISQVVRTEDLRKAPGLREACKILFEDQADEKYEEYFREHS
ncbi:MAG: glycerol-3-phosphate dehydrogenase/oxidase [Pseudomonadota bacterium]|nr:FAD-dependent oxidoreductase [Pseudomonadales bacterium]MDY6921046.1 glycerol-3-phosphate dehydrogenase/oxidase [Pseudomonadota bacterium]